MAYLRTILPHAEDAFFEYLAAVDCSNIKVYAIKVHFALFVFFLNAVQVWF